MVITWACFCSTLQSAFSYAAVVLDAHDSYLGCSAVLPALIYLAGSCSDSGASMLDAMILLIVSGMKSAPTTLLLDFYEACFC